MCRGERVVREGIAETSITMLKCQFYIHCCSIVLLGVVLSVDKNRNWCVASDCLVGLRYVKCKLGFDWTLDVACIGTLLT